MTTVTDALIIGAGHMGYAIALGLKRSNPSISLTAIDPEHTHRKHLKNAGISVKDRVPKSIKSEIIVLAIPPQAFAKLVQENVQLEHYAGMTASVMAGINLSALSTRLKTSQVCRAIPNLPCAINQGMSVLMHDPRTTQKNRRLANDFFSQLGSLLVVKKEALIDNATALAGGGPAYVSYFAEALIEYATLAGFDKTSAHSMVTQILCGTTALLESLKQSPSKLSEKVMPPKGTTEKAINFLNDKQVRSIIVDALKHSSARSRELGRRFQTCWD